MDSKRVWMKGGYENGLAWCKKRLHPPSMQLCHFLPADYICLGPNPIHHQKGSLAKKVHDGSKNRGYDLIGKYKILILTSWWALKLPIGLLRHMSHFWCCEGKESTTITALTECTNTHNPFTLNSFWRVWVVNGCALTTLVAMVVLFEELWSGGPVSPAAPGPRVPAR